MISLEKNYTPGDYERIGIIKKAADEVYAYMSRIIADHTLALVEKNHQKMIETLTEDVSTILGLTPHRAQLGLYFVANVIRTVREIEEGRTNIKGWMVFNDGMLGDLYDPAQVSFLTGEFNSQNACMYAGIFMAEQTEAHADLAQVQAGALVGCDDIFVTSLEWNTLLDVMDIEGTDFTDVGQAVCMASAEAAEVLEQANDLKP